MLNYRTQVSVQDGATLYGFWPLRTNETCSKWLKSVVNRIICTFTPLGKVFRRCYAASV
jgi:hypothetical protein